MTDQKDYQKEIQDTFLAEAIDMLHCLEGYFLELEKKNYDPCIFDQLFRIAHNLKGSGKVVGFDEISSLAHELESLLVLIRTGELLVSAAVIELLLFCGDKLKEDVTLLQENPHSKLNHQVVLDLIQATIANKNQVNLLNSKSTLHEQPPTPPPSVNLPCKQTEGGPENKTENKEEYVRISLRKLDDLLINFGEQVILQSVLDHAKFNLKENSDLLLKTISQLSKLTYDLHQTAITLRMVSLKQLFCKMERAVRDTSSALNKKVNFILEGSDNELDKTIVDALSDPLTHMIRNSIDHGIETEDERILAGKNPIGQVVLRGYRRGGLFYIQIQDDGRGLDPEKLLKKAIGMGLVQETAVLSKEHIYDLIFENGFSTKDQVSDISGRGVGMNVVRESLRKVKGECHIESAIGGGTTFTIRVPLTLSIFNGIVIKVDGIHYVVPSSDVLEVFSVASSSYRHLNTNESCVQIRSSVLPIIDLKAALKLKDSLHVTRETKRNDTLLVVKTPLGRKALIVDELIAQHKVVHKSLAPETRHIRGATGVTILGNGTVALILDLSSIQADAL